TGGGAFGGGPGEAVLAVVDVVRFPASAEAEPRLAPCNSFDPTLQLRDVCLLGPGHRALVAAWGKGTPELAGDRDGVNHVVPTVRLRGANADHSAWLSVSVSITGGPSGRRSPFQSQRLPLSTAAGAHCRPPPAT